MSLVAAFLWSKSTSSIATVIFDDDTMQVLSTPKITYFPPYSFKFKRIMKQFIRAFCDDIKVLSATSQQRIIIEYKIVFITRRWRYMVPSKESKYVYKIFQQMMNKLSNRIPEIDLKSQIRNKLKGKHLLAFNRKLRSLNLVSRKVNTRFEYNLWAVALHATKKSYEKSLAKISEKLMEAFWRNE